MKYALLVTFALKVISVLKLYFAPKVQFALTNSSLCTIGKIYNKSAYCTKKHLAPKVYFQAIYRIYSLLLLWKISPSYWKGDV